MKPGASRTDSSPSRLACTLPCCTNICAGIAAAIGLIVIAGWILGNTPLKSVMYNLPAMKLNVAIACVLAAIALWNRHLRGFPIVIGVVLALVGTLTLGEYATGHDFFIDRLFLTDHMLAREATPTPGRMAPHSALCLLLIGTALALLRFPRTWTRILIEILLLCVALVTLLSLFGYTKGINNLIGLEYTKPIALNSAIAFLFLSIGIVCANSDSTVTLILSSRGTSRLLWIGFGLLSALLLVLGIHSLTSLSVINHNLDTLATIARPRNNATRALETNAQAHYNETLNFLSGKASSRARTATQATQFENSLADYRRCAQNPGQEELAARTSTLWAAYSAIARPLLAAGKASPQDLESLTAHHDALHSFISKELQPDALAALRTATTNTSLILESLGTVTLLLLFTAITAALITSTTVARAVIHNDTTLKETTRKLSTLLQNLPGMAYRCKNTPQWPMEYISDYALELTGYPADEFVSGLVTYGDLIHPDDRDTVWKNVQLALDKKEPFPLEYRIRHADGSIRTIWERGRGVFDPAGQLLALEGFMLDISDLKRAEENERKLQTHLQQTQKLESLGVLAGGIAHDFNNLLTTILGHADLALQHLPSSSPARNLVNEVVTGARQAAELTKQMLAYSGKGRFIVEPVNLSVLVDDMSRLLNISLPKKCIIKLDLAPLLPSIEADASQMGQIIMNLIINAAEAIGDRSGVISITTGAMHCDAGYLAETYLDDQLPDGMYVFLEVADTGIGMDEATRKKIFDPFFSTKFTGRGLGLSAVLGIVRGHKGAIRCYSEPNRGTSFRLLFPASDLPALPAAKASSTPKSWRGHGTVLVVDDEESVRNLARHMLELMGFTVKTALNGRDALNQFRQDSQHIRLVLLDLTMPELDGEETFRELRRIRPDVRTILSSGYNEQTATQRFVGRGLAAFIQKPYLFNQLQKIIQQALDEAPAPHSQSAKT